MDRQAERGCCDHVAIENLNPSGVRRPSWFWLLHSTTTPGAAGGGWNISPIAHMNCCGRFQCATAFRDIPMTRFLLNCGIIVGQTNTEVQRPYVRRSRLKSSGGKMSHSLSLINVHLIFCIKRGAPMITPDIRPGLFSYIGGLLGKSNCLPIAINGPGDHVHSLFTLGKNISISQMVEELKRNSSKWIKRIGSDYSSFYWQRGYGVFSVSFSSIGTVKKYVLNQEKHHMIFSFEHERAAFLNAHGLTLSDWTID
jgi:putative transposase